MERKCKMKKILLFLLLLILLAAAGLAFIILRGGLPEINGAWCEVGTSDPTSLTISGGRMAFRNGSDAGGNCTYKVAGDREAVEIRLEFGEGAPFEYVIYHRQFIGEQEIHILSTFITELDGRGPIVVCEFVRREELAFLPEDFTSELYHTYNDAVPIPTVALADENGEAVPAPESETEAAQEALTE